MKNKPGTDPAQILLFPTGESVSVIDTQPQEPAPVWLPDGSPHPPRDTRNGEYEVVLSGSFRRDVEGLRRAYEELRDLGFRILSPSHVDPGKEIDGFVFMKGEESETPERLELQHLKAIQQAAFVWLFAPEGYVGLSAALEVGFAHAQGIPVFSRDQVVDATLRPFVRNVDRAALIPELLKSGNVPIPAPIAPAFQKYYKRVATRRGYERETAQNCLLLMVEEVGELARAIRKREKLVRHGSSRTNEAHELADVFLYVVHMANILGLDLGSAVREKEELNLARFVSPR